MSNANDCATASGKLATRRGHIAPFVLGTFGIKGAITVQCSGLGEVQGSRTRGTGIVVSGRSLVIHVIGRINNNQARLGYIEEAPDLIPSGCTRAPTSVLEVISSAVHPATRVYLRRYHPQMTLTLSAWPAMPFRASC